MTWILIEGLDRSGKSSLTESYKKQGYTVVHMEAPSKKFYADNYSGETYFEELVRMYGKYAGQKVVFDRTPYGELVWPNIYGRKALLEAEDLDYLGELERNNSAERILMFDKNIEAHWQRCVDNNEPLTRQQFGRASIFYDRLASDYGFKKKQLTDFDEFSGVTKSPSSSATVVSTNEDPSKTKPDEPGSVRSTVDSSRAQQFTLDNKLELANAIKDVLQGKILKKKGGLYDELENQIKVFLQDKLEEIFVGKQDKTFSEEETMILKLYAKRIKEKM
jgi:hypothetical protein